VLALALLPLSAARGMAQTAYQSAIKVAELEHAEILESSGLAASWRHPGRFWTHNDSGGTPCLYAFDAQGRHLGCCRLRGTQPTDWEALGSFAIDGRCYLFVADVGDNLRKRTECQILILREPDSADAEAVPHVLRFVYEDGPRDCEAVAYDPAARQFLLVEKLLLGLSCRVYQLAWPAASPEPRRVARAIARIPVPFATGMDISADGKRLVVATYGEGYEFVRKPSEDWSQALASKGFSIPLPTLPIRRQGEAICYGTDGVTLYLTSEKRPCPLFVLHPQK
jgi:hypothetical protein